MIVIVDYSYKKEIKNIEIEIETFSDEIIISHIIKDLIKLEIYDEEYIENNPIQFSVAIYE